MTKFRIKTTQKAKQQTSQKRKKAQAKQTNQMNSLKAANTQKFKRKPAGVRKAQPRAQNTNQSRVLVTQYTPNAKPLERATFSFNKRNNKI